jgi:endonuclease-3 related protein
MKLQPGVGAAQRRRVAALLPRLLDAYGAQGWWPLRSLAGSPGFDEHGYHPGDYGQPPDASGRFEIAAGAVLTQNTAWRNVEAALDALLRDGPVGPGTILSLPPGSLAAKIRPSGYFRQKARKLRALARFIAGQGDKAPAREDLLAIWGIGPETADSILLYAYGQTRFVVDAYTRRLYGRLGLISGSESYDAVAALCLDALPRDAPGCNEMHALIVRHAREHCRSVPLCRGCPLARGCPRHGVAPRGR